MYKRNIKPLPFIFKPLPLIIPSRTIILFRFSINEFIHFLSYVTQFTFLLAP